jgi:hypothetical protein
MRPSFLKQIFTAVSLFGLLADGAVAAPPAVIDSKTLAPTSPAVVPQVAAPTPQTNVPIGGTFASAMMGGAQSPGYFRATYPTAWGGLMGLSPLGGTLYPGPIGGIMNGLMPPGGRMPNVIVTGASPPGGLLSGRPSGGQFGTNILGGIGAASNSFAARTSGVIIAGGAQPGGAQTAGASPGGVIIAGSSPGGKQNAGASPGGVIVVGGTPANTNAPGGQLH